MLNVTDAQKTAYMEAVGLFQVTVTFPNKASATPGEPLKFTNEDLVEESIELIESIEDSQYLQFKGCIASQLDFKVADIVQDLRGEYVEVDIKAGTTEALPLFRGYVYTQTNQTQEDIFTEFSCFDILKSVRGEDIKAWYNALTFPITIKNFRDSLFTHLGIEQASVTLPNDAQSIKKESVDTLYAGDVLEAICQANGRFGQIGRDGKFYYRTLDIITEGLYPSTHTFPSSTTYPSGENARVIFSPKYYRSVRYEPFSAEAIDQVIIVKANNATERTGSGTNALVLEDNIVARNFSSFATPLANIYAEVERRPYVPMDLKCVGLPFMECGDIFLSYTTKNVVRSYILRRRLSGIQALLDNYEGDGSQYRPLYQESPEQKSTANRTQGITNASRIEVVDGKFNHLDADKIDAGTLKAERIGANTISVEKLTGSIKDSGNTWEINLTNGSMTIGNISANKITTGTLNAGLIGANSISASQLKADTFASWSLSCQSVSAGSAFYYGGNRYYARSVTINGQGYTILAQ